MPEPLPDFSRLIAALDAQRVRFVVIGGLALVARGSAYVTYDLDVCYARDKDNLEALARALAPLHPQLRTVSGPVPFLWDARTLKAGANFTLVTDAGSVDLLGDVAGVDSFSSLWERAAEIELFGIHVRVASIDDLIAMKRAAGRLKDQAHILELEALKRLIEPGSDAEGTEERQG